ncbi:MAG: amidophosphoribosyltransferase [Lentisphaerae bacterium GWF2_45_14]|nr:MAG: amidophosphoribosyltransferase [Lentisphaerae bacterium GWF2_45_14]
MSEDIKHECGIAFVRLLKPLEYYQEKYGTSFYGLNLMYLLMEKQHNRGQDGAGIAAIKFDMPPGTPYISIEKSNSSSAIGDIFKKINEETSKTIRKNKENPSDINWIKANTPFCAELFLGHLRYGTYGNNNIECCHPFIRDNNWMSRSLVLAGNFNLTNVDELFDILVEVGQHPVDKSDTVTVLEKIGHFLDEENDRLVKQYKSEGFAKYEISNLIAKNIDLQSILVNACKKWDGGYIIAGLIGHGDAFIIRDPAGIRPVFYYSDDEIAIVTSERPVIQTALNVDIDLIKEIKPAHALLIRRDGRITEKPFTREIEKRSCSFERIYFSRGTDADIYKERKALGRYLTPTVLKHTNYDIENTVFSFIPNTAETCYIGMKEALKKYCSDYHRKKILELGANVTPEKLGAILAYFPRFEKIAVKDVKLRTFITEDKQRNDLVAHVYDITYGSLRRGKDTLVIIDDSIVRGTTLKESILRILDRLGPKEIVLVSSAPQIRYPDCYGIDMARLGDLVAFNAAIELLKERGREKIIKKVYDRCKEHENLPKDQAINHIKDIYRPFSAEEISGKITELLTPPGINAKVHIIYQSIESLHRACPGHSGDWYFTGDYPTPGGNKVVNKSFINYIEGVKGRAY